MNKLDRFRKSGSRRSIIIGDNAGNEKKGKILVDPTRISIIEQITPKVEQKTKHKRSKSN